MYEVLLNCSWELASAQAVLGKLDMALETDSIGEGKIILAVLLVVKLA